MKRKIDGDFLTIIDDGDNAILVIEVKRTDDETTLTVSGSITHDAAPEFEDELISVLTSGCRVAVDFSKLEHISAPALNTLLSIQKLVDEKKYRFHIHSLSDSVLKIFEQTGFIDLLEIR
jgi:anti-anti-sigma factor